MAKVKGNGLTVLHIRENSKWVRRTVMEKFHIIMEIHIKENGILMLDKARVLYRRRSAILLQ
jgi:hypothetical protein